MAHIMIDAGASIIMGHHPHVLRGMEKYNNGSIFYGLGNFVFDMIWVDDTRIGIILRCDLYRAGKTENVQIIPFRINIRFQPQLLSGKEKERFLSQFEKLSSKIAHKKSSDIHQQIEAYITNGMRHRKWASRRMLNFILKNFYKLSAYTIWFIIIAKLKKMKEVIKRCLTIQ